MLVDKCYVCGMDIEPCNLVDAICGKCVNEALSDEIDAESEGECLQL